MNSRERRAIAAAEHNEKRLQHLEAVRYNERLKAHTQGQRVGRKVGFYIDAREKGLTARQALLAAAAMAQGLVLF